VRMNVPSAQCFPHEVSHTYNTWKNDSDGGRILASSLIRWGYDCSVQPGEMRTEIEDNRETGLRRVTFFTQYIIIYPENPKLNVHDVILWIDDFSDDVNPTRHTIVVTKSRNAVGLGSVWEVSGEERI
jgi:hypothetical protein